MLKQTRANSTVSLPRGLEWAFAAGGIAFLALFVWFAKEIISAQAAKSWPSVVGRITHMEYAPASSRTGSSGVREVPVYAYSVAGVDYTGQRAGLAFPGMGDGIFGPEFEARTRHLRKPGQVTVYYNPGNPASAVILNDGAGWLVWVFTAGWLLGSAMFTYAFLRIRRGDFGRLLETR